MSSTESFSQHAKHYIRTMWYYIYPKYWDRQAWADCADPDQTIQNVASEQGIQSMQPIQQFLNTSSCSKMDAQILEQIQLRIWVSLLIVCDSKASSWKLWFDLNIVTRSFKQNNHSYLVVSWVYVWPLTLLLE